jgi:anthranilate synthase component 1
VEPITLKQFREFATSFNVIPVARKLLADSETPLSIYRKLSKNLPGTFLLESAEHGGRWARYSFIGVSSASTLTEHNGLATWIGSQPAGAPNGINPVEALNISAAHLRSPKIAGLPPLTGGLVGYLSYEVVRRIEYLPNQKPDDVGVPELAFMLTSDLAVYDHKDGSVTLIANAINWDGSSERVDWAYQDALDRLTAMSHDLMSTASATASKLPQKVSPNFSRSMTDENFTEKVAKIKAEIVKGEAFQVVLSQRFSSKCEADALDVYRTLRGQNPSPYMYLFRFHDNLNIVGSSPEALVKITNEEALIHPIAGTRARNPDSKIDDEIAKELLADPKERAEHLMLVDLGRNDLGRVCLPGTVEVTEFMQIEKYSHVMHIVSTVTGKIDKKFSILDVILSVFPAGTLSGAPKPRAMEIIDDHEITRRGIYGGAIGYIDFTGNADTCIAIRTAVIKNKVAYVQAGAGIVADSDPAAENQECLNKAAAVLGAIASANS